MARDGKNGNGTTQSNGSAGSRLLTEHEVAARLNVAVVTLQGWRPQQKGPPFIRLETRLIRYREVDLETWIASHEVVRPARLIGAGHGANSDYFRKYEGQEPVDSARAEAADLAASDPPSLYQNGIVDRSEDGADGAEQAQVAAPSRSRGGL
jgi:predicted DNA-binding transcriptional regulator AlpA